jgi:hypothetical protein
MKDLKHASETDLLDRLFEFTSAYMRMLIRGASRTLFYQCKNELDYIQKELQSHNTMPDKRNDGPPGTNHPGIEDYI